VAIAVQGLFSVVDVVMAVGADEGEVGDVCFALGGCVPGDEVVGFAFGWVGAAADAAFVPGDQSADLGLGGEPFLATGVEKFAVLIEQDVDEGGGASVAVKHAGGDGASIAKVRT